MGIPFARRFAEIRNKRLSNGAGADVARSKRKLMTENYENELQARLELAETLIWALLDNHISEAQQAELCKLMEEDAAVRAKYIDCVQLHVDLTEHYGRKAAEQKPGAIVLPNLSPGVTGLEGLPQVTE
jgi:hypothetical protein